MSATLTILLCTEKLPVVNPNAPRWGFLLKNSMVVKSDSKQGNECNRIQILGSIKAMRP